MDTEESPLDRTPDLLAKIRALREQAEREMDRFTGPDDYDIRRVTGRKPRPDSTEAPLPPNPKKKQTKRTDQASLDFSSAPAERETHDGEEA